MAFVYAIKGGGWIVSMCEEGGLFRGGVTKQTFHSPTSIKRLHPNTVKCPKKIHYIPPISRITVAKRNSVIFENTVWYFRKQNILLPAHAISGKFIKSWHDGSYCIVMWSLTHLTRESITIIDNMMRIDQTVSLYRGIDLSRTILPSLCTMTQLF